MFLEKFKKKLIFFDNNPSEDKNMIYYPHSLRLYTKTAVYLRNKYICNIVRNYEIEKNIKYDIIITLRPDLYFTKWDIDLKKIIYNVINNNSIYIQETKYVAVSGPRPDCIFISKYFLSELVTDELINEKTKDIPDGLAYQHKKLKKSKHDYFEDFINIELKPILLNNVYKFFEFYNIFQ